MGRQNAKIWSSHLDVYVIVINIKVVSYVLCFQFTFEVYLDQYLCIMYNLD